MVKFPRLNRTVKIVLVVFGVFLAAFLAAFVFFAGRIAHSEDPGMPQRVAAQLANFTVPKGFRATNGLELPIMKQATFVSTDPKKPMTIVLQGVYMPATKESMDQSVMLSMRSRCASSVPLGDDLLTVNGALFTLHRVSCAQAGKPTYEYEFGSFVGKAPIVAIIAFAPQVAWDPAPIHALLKSLH